MPSEGRYCPNCGRWIEAGLDQCPHCGGQPALRRSKREWVLAIALGLLIPFFVLTGILARAYHAREKAFAAQWSSEGNALLKAGQPDAAAVALQNSLAYDPVDESAQLQMVEALASTGHELEARSYLDAVLAKDPGNGPANLDRARLAVQENSTQGALRYYHNAIYGEWPESQQSKRLQVRLELCHYLLKRNDLADGVAELISLSAAASPSDTAIHMEVGNLFLQTNTPTRALHEFQTVLGSQPENADALKGAGIASLQLDDYAHAETYFAAALRLRRGDAYIQQQLDEVRSVLDADPFVRGLSREAQIHRTEQAYQTALARLRSCAASHQQPLDQTPPSTPWEDAYARSVKMAPWLHTGKMDVRSGRAAEVMQLVSDIEKLTASTCGEPTGPDLALLRLAQMPRGIP